MTTELKATLADHAAGNYRVLLNLSDELLAVALDRELPGLNEKLTSKSLLNLHAPPNDLCPDPEPSVAQAAAILRSTQLLRGQLHEYRLLRPVLPDL